MAAVAFDAFGKVFGGTTAVDALELEIPEGSIYGLLGLTLRERE